MLSQGYLALYALFLYENILLICAQFKLVIYDKMHNIIYIFFLEQLYFSIRDISISKYMTVAVESTHICVCDCDVDLTAIRPDEMLSQFNGPKAKTTCTHNQQIDGAWK